MRLGILGGAFDPIHYGHLRASEEVYESLSLDGVLLIPTASPPHKTDRSVTRFEHRLQMAELAIHGLSHFAVSDIEKSIPGHSYSIETLRRLQGLYGPKAQFYFMVGLDAFSELPTWKEYKSLLSYTNLVVVSRTGYTQSELETILTKHFPNYTYNDSHMEYSLSGQLSVYYRKTTCLDISSTFIRRAVCTGRSIRFLVPLLVEEYIHRMKLYGK